MTSLKDDFHLTVILHRVKTVPEVDMLYPRYQHSLNHKLVKEVEFLLNFSKMFEVPFKYLKPHQPFNRFTITLLGFRSHVPTNHAHDCAISDLEHTYMLPPTASI